MMGKKNYLEHDIFKAGLVGLLAVAINLIPTERIFGVALTDFGVMPTIYLLPMFFVYGLIALVFSGIKRNLNLDRNAAFFTNTFAKIRR